MKRTQSFFGIALLLLMGALPAVAEETPFSKRFAKGAQSFGLEVGMGYTFDLPTGVDRTDITYLFFFPNFQYNLTGLMGKSWYRGTLDWQLEAGVASALNHDGEYLLGVSPLLFKYKFLNKNRGWAPNLLMGAGFSYTNWDDVASAELGGSFQFLLHAGAGLEFFRDKWSYSINYRLLHVSNSGIERPNIGLNGHTFNIGIQF